MRRSKKVVVARYNEDISWLDTLKSRGWKDVVVQKGEDMPNEGRESSSYFWAINKLYPQIKNSDVFAFLQGDPCGNGPFGSRENVLDDIKLVGSFTPLGTWRCASDGNGNPFHPGLPIREKYEKWIGGTFPGEVSFTAGCQFLVTGREIKHFKRSFYGKMTKEMCEGQNPWVMERLVEELFKLASNAKSAKK